MGRLEFSLWIFRESLFRLGKHQTRLERRCQLEGRLTWWKRESRSERAKETAEQLDISLSKQAECEQHTQVASSTRTIADWKAWHHEEGSSDFEGSTNGTVRVNVSVNVTIVAHV